MTQERFRQIEELYHACREANSGERIALLAQADSDLRSEVESLLVERHDSDFLDRPAIQNFPELPDDSTVAEVSAGAILGPYRIENKLGEGGMGKVYRAIDMRLGRPVAIKIAHEQFNSRFGREARVISSLNHPNICTVHDVGPNYLVMELVEGETLADRLKEGSLPVEMVARYGMQIAAALADAHEKGIVHRDLKPGNIMIAKSRVKVLDFGLAKSMHDETLSCSHIVMGTPAYMSPEQRRGKPADARSDIYSFGCVLYEMIAGTQMGPMRKRIPSAKMEKIVSRCLQEDPECRWQSATEMEGELADVAGSGSHEKFRLAVSSAMPSLSGTWPYGALLLVIAVVIGGAHFYSTRKSSVPAAGPASWVQLTDFADSAVSPALSPDGRVLAFVRGPDTFIGNGEIYAKLLPNGEMVQLTHDGAEKMSPEFSTDGTRIAYTASLGSWETWVVPVLGGQPRLMFGNAEGLTWIDEKNLLFSETRKGIHMVLVSAGENRGNTRDVYVPPRERGMAHRSAISPDHKWVLLTEMDNGGWLPCRLVPFDGSSSGRVVGPASGACTYVAWSPDGAWMYFSSDAGGRFHIWRQRLAEGTPQQVTSGATEEEGIAVTPDGRSLITSVGLVQSIIMLHDAKGERPVSSVSYSASPQFVANGKYIFYMVQPRQAQAHQFVSGELYRVDLESGNTERLLPDISVDGYAVSPDGNRIVYSAADAQGHDHLWIADVDLRSSPHQYPSLTGEDQPALDDKGNIYFRAAEGGSNFLYRMKQDGSGRVRLIPHPILELHGVSPDGRWALIYQSPPLRTDGLLELDAAPLSGGTAVTICTHECFAMWGNHGKTLAVHLYMSGGRKKTVLVPVRGGGSPLLPPGGFNPTEELMAPKGSKVVDDVIIPGPNSKQYAYLRQSVHRNLYSIPLP